MKWAVMAGVNGRIITSKTNETKNETSEIKVDYNQIYGIRKEYFDHIKN